MARSYLVFPPKKIWLKNLKNTYQKYGGIDGFSAYMSSFHTFIMKLN